jgi:hypothetical protein
MAQDNDQQQTSTPNQGGQQGAGQGDRSGQQQQQQKNDGSQPGVLGDWTEEQNLGQPGNPDARIKKDEVEEAFRNQDKA